jgi:hypothetical protein
MTGVSAVRGVALGSGGRGQRVEGIWEVRGRDWGGLDWIDCLMALSRECVCL